MHKKGNLDIIDVVTTQSSLMLILVTSLKELSFQYMDFSNLVIVNYEFIGLMATYIISSPYLDCGLNGR